MLQGTRQQHYFAARRFDRDGKRRAHVHSASGLLYADIRMPTLDYSDLILLTRFLTRDQRECESLFALAVFNVLAHNRDDHARQFSFIMQRDGTWRLAPAYDLTWSPGPGGEHSSSILGHGKDISRAHVMALSKKADIAEHDAAQIIERTQTAIDRWDSYAAEYGVSQASAAMINAALARVWLDRIV